MKFEAAPEPGYRTPRWKAAIWMFGALAFGLDAVLLREEPARLLGSLAGLMIAGVYWRRSRRAPKAAEPELEGRQGRGAFPLSGRGASRGFTLIEIMMTVAITALVFAMIGGILISVINAAEKIEIKTRTEKAGYGALSLLRRDLTGVYAYSLGGIAFRGENTDEGGKDADKLTFVTTANVVETEDGVPPRLVEVGYQFGDEDDGLVMFRRAAPLEGDPLAGDGEYVEVLSGIQSFNLEYYDRETKEWKEGLWDSADKLPKAVRVKLELALSETQRMQAEQNDVELPSPLYEMTVGIPANAQPVLSAPDPAAAPAGS